MLGPEGRALAGFHHYWSLSVLHPVVEKSYLLQDYPSVDEEWHYRPAGNDSAASSVDENGRARGYDAGPPMPLPPVWPGRASGPIEVFRKSPWDVPARLGFGYLQDVLTAFQWRTFDVRSPFSFREGLAKILEDISKM
jgi:hypothetical protein